MKLRAILMLIVCAALLQACEDDPILSPSAAKAKGGSYSKTNLPGNPADSSRQQPYDASQSNPRIF